MIWINVDSGANIHISNDPLTIRNIKPSTRGIDQADGKPTLAKSIGNWTFWLGNRFVHSKSTFLMPGNSISTLGSAALKLQDGYVSTHHDQFDFATYVHAGGSSFSFTKENGLLRTINALDYVPIVCYMNEIPSPEKAICKQAQLRKSQRLRKQTTKMVEYNKTLEKNKNTNKVLNSPTQTFPISTSPAKIKHSSSNTSIPSPSLHVLQSNSDTTTITSSNSPTENQEKDMIVSGFLSTLITHLKFGCRNHKSLRHMHTTQALENMPSISLPKTPCPVCLLVKNTRLTKNKETTMGTFRPGQLMMMDFAYSSCTSIRGYVAYFSVTCQATGFGFVFCVPNKRPPLSLISWISETMKRQGRPISFVRFDEGGELACSQQVCQLLIDLNIVMQTTGGYSSSLLGKDERQHRTLAEMITSMLYSAGLPSSY